MRISARPGSSASGPQPAEEFLIEGIVSLGCLTRRIDQAETARLNRRISYGVIEEAAPGCAK